MSKSQRKGEAPPSKGSKKLLRCCRALSRLILFALGFYTVKVYGYPADTKISVSNHLSILDPFWIFSKKGCSFVAMESIKKWPIIGSIGKSMRTIFVKRDLAKSREEALTKIMDNVKPPFAPPIHIFSEGRCENGKCLLPFHKGAFAPGLAIQPAMIRYPFKHFDPSSGCGSVNVFYWIRMLCQFVNRMEVHYYPTWYPSEIEKKDPIIYSRNVRQFLFK